MTTGMELIEKGKKEGYEQAKRDDARKMLADDMHVSLIEKYTGLSRKEIEALRD